MTPAEEFGRWGWLLVAGWCLLALASALAPLLRCP